MKIRFWWVALIALAVLAGGCEKKKEGTAGGGEEQFFPMLTYRTGAYAPSGIPIANAARDFYQMLNLRDGGINGVKAVSEECETKYDTKLIVECYEKLKSKGKTAIINPYSTGGTYAIMPKAPVDQIPILSMGYGRTAAADGRIFKWTFNFPTTYWSQASAVIRYFGEQEGGLEKLRGKKIAHVFHNSAYGKEANPTLEVLAKKFGYELILLAVNHPGQEQKATWLQIRQLKPDWVFMSGWGVMNQVAVKEAAAINYPMDHFVGNWWSGTETDVVPAGDGAVGYKSTTFTGVGTDFQVHKDILQHVYKGNLEEAKKNNFGEVLYNRMLVNAMFNVEAVRTAQAQYGNKAMSGEQVRWGLENLDITSDRLTANGFAGLVNPIKVSCKDHETAGPVRIQQWDGKAWKIVTDWIPTMDDVVRPMIEEAAAAFAKENNLQPRTDCA